MSYITGVMGIGPKIIDVFGYGILVADRIVCFAMENASR